MFVYIYIYYSNEKWKENEMSLGLNGEHFSFVMFLFFLYKAYLIRSLIMFSMVLLSNHMFQFNTVLSTNNNNVQAHLCPNKFSHQKNFDYNLRTRNN